MKICFIIASLANGGAERVLATLANQFCKKNEVKIIKFNQEKSFYKIDKSIEITSFPAFKTKSILDKIKLRFKKFFTLRKALKEAKSDIFISFLDTTNIACIMAKWGLKTPLIICEHSSNFYLKSKFWLFLRRIFYSYADALSVLSEDDKNFYKAFVKNVKVLLNPCEFSVCGDLKEDFKKENCVIFVGRLDENKNAKMFLRAVSNLPLNIRENCEFLVVGDGVESENLKILAKNLKISVNFLGKTKDIKSVYERAKIICLCSFVEGLPSVLIESIFFNVARISTKYRGAGLIENEKDGFLVECDDFKAMGEKITLLLNDENLRLKITKNAQKKCELFSIESIERQWFELINEVIKKA